MASRELFVPVDVSGLWEDLGPLVLPSQFLLPVLRLSLPPQVLLQSLGSWMCGPFIPVAPEGDFWVHQPRAAGSLWLPTTAGSARPEVTGTHWSWWAAEISIGFLGEYKSLLSERPRVVPVPAKVKAPPGFPTCPAFPALPKWECPASC